MTTATRDQADASTLNKTILVIEDDVLLCEILALHFEIGGFATVHASTGSLGIKEAAAGAYQLILLDLNLPDMSGIEVFRKIRTFAATPIIMITTRSDENDRLLGLELGADDYIVKPFNPREVVARARNIIKRTIVRTVTAEHHPSTKTFGDLAIDETRHIATISNKSLSLTRAEFKILYFLTENHGNICTRNMLISVVTDDQNDIFDRTLDRHIANIRRKLGEAPTKPTYIETVIGVGYRFKSELTQNGYAT